MHYLKLVLKRVLMARILIVLLCLISALQNVNSQLQRSPSSSLIEDDIGIHTEYVDKHNETILKMFNLTEAQMNRIHSSNGANDKNSSSQHRDSKYFDSIKEYREDLKELSMRPFPILTNPSFDRRRLMDPIDWYADNLLKPNPFTFSDYY